MMTNTAQKTKGRVDSLDKFIGQRVRKLRVVKGLSQEKLAEQLGITFQQVQKYEQGTNRISVSRLIYISKALGTPIDYFFKNLQSKPSNGLAESEQDTFKPETENAENIFESRETVDLLKVYYSLQDKASRKDLMKIIRMFVQNSTDS
tara:strand:+ start:905 stop:1348 length:444 start_codon:yes stop_codon:yes gene_type:complete